MIIGWGWNYLSTNLDDYRRYIIAWKLCTTMRAGDVADALEMALEASGCDQATVHHKPRLLSDNGASYVSGDLAASLPSMSFTAGLKPPSEKGKNQETDNPKPPLATSKQVA